MDNSPVAVAPLTSEVESSIIVACEIGAQLHQLKHTGRALTAHHLDSTAEKDGSNELNRLQPILQLYAGLYEPTVGNMQTITTA